MALLGFIPAEGGLGATDDEKQPRFIHNDSGRFESRWVTVGIDEKTPAVMLDGMGGSKIGVWIAHGEGKAKFPDESRLAPVLANGQAAVRYVDHTRRTHHAVPAQPQRVPRGYRGHVLGGWSPPRHDAAPGARVPRMADALVPGGQRTHR